MLKIVISPAKKMNITDEFPCNATVPVFSDRADVLHGILKNKNIQELKCSPSHFIRILRNLKTDRQSYSLSFGNAGKVRSC